MVFPNDPHRSIQVAMLGARMNYAVPRLLHAAGRLAHFYTDLCAGKGWLQTLRLVPTALRPGPLRRLLGRVPADVPVQDITAFTGFGLEYARRLRQARTDTQRSEVYLWAGKRFGEMVLRNGLPSAGGVYTFNSAGLEILQAARDRGLCSWHEQTSAAMEHFQNLLAEEHARFPHWESDFVEAPVAKAGAERERDEWSLTNWIVCGSEFVQQSIAACGGPADRCIVVPYGVAPDFVLADRLPHAGPLRVLTVGSIRLCKGTPYVAAAARRMKGRAVFRVVGPSQVSAKALDELRSVVEVIGAVPRSEVLAHYAWADVFLLPSICEGSATVTYEALAAGLPVVCTPNTGSVVRHGREGFVVPIRDVEALVAALEQLADDPALRRELAVNARLMLGEITLDGYGQRLLRALDRTST